MTPHDLIAAFDTISEAPDGVSRLRELVLELAFRGKLISQDAGDEPATTLLKCLAHQKLELVKSKQISKPKSLPAIRKDDLPFDLPRGWSWCKLGDVSLSFQNGTSRRRGTGTSTVVIRLADIENRRLRDNGFREIELSHGDIAKYSLEADDILAIRVNGSATLVGRLIPVTEARGWAYCDHFIRVRLSNDYVLPRYICEFGNTIAARAQIESVTVTTAGQRTVNQTGLGNLLVPIAPLAEQHRIVAKVDELMGLLDRLEAARRSREAARTASRDSALAALRDADTPEKVGVAWTRIAERIDDLSTSPGDVSPLREAVLQLGIRGCLTRQKPEFATASEQLQNITDEIERLVIEKKLSRPKPLPRIKDEERAFQLPTGWAWCRLGEIVRVSSGEYLPSKKMSGGDVPVYGGNGVTGFHDVSNVDGETVVVGRVGALCGNVHVTPAKAWVTDNAFIVWFSHTNLDREFLVLLLRATDLGRDSRATAQPVISGRKIYPMLVAIPPLQEQRKIVASVDTTMALLDQLEEHLIAAQTSHDAFAAAAVHHLDS